MTEQLPPIESCVTMQLEGVDETDADVLNGKRRSLMRALTEISPGTHLAVLCDGESFSHGVVQILLNMSYAMELKRSKMAVIGLSPAAEQSLRSHVGGDGIRTCKDSTELVYGGEGET